MTRCKTDEGRGAQALLGLLMPPACPAGSSTTDPRGPGGVAADAAADDDDGRDAEPPTWSSHVPTKIEIYKGF